MILQTLGIAMLCGSMAVPTTNIQHKNVSYDDTQYQITLSKDELNNYEFINLGTYLSQSPNYNNTYFASILYEGSTFLPGNLDNTFFSYYYNNSYPRIWFSYSTYNVSDRANQFHLAFSGFIFNDFGSSITLVVKSEYYDTIKSLIEQDISSYIHDSLYDLIYDYFEDTIFNSESLTEYSSEVLGQTITLQTWLCTTATIITLIVILVFCLGFIVMLIKFTSNMMINLGR